jgi:uncharacterized cupredoxin-like copper-binding protein
MQNYRLIAAVLGAMFLSGTAVHAAGSHSGGHGKGHGFAFGKPGNSTETDRTVDIVMKDSFYEPKSIAIEAGETVRFRVVNKGELVHEFNLGTAEMHAAHRKEMTMMADNGVLEADRINHHMMKKGGMMHDDPNSVLLEPGKSGEIVWHFSKAAALEFACNVPGHYEAGMTGRVRFK